MELEERCSITTENETQGKLFENSGKEEREQDGRRETEPLTVANCEFCKIVRGEIKTHVIFRDEISMAFLDRRPVFLGHCLLIPLSHYETLADLPQALVGPIFSSAKSLSIGVQKGLQADGTFVAMNNRVSQSVPHLHVHVVPRRAKDGLRGFFWPRQTYSSEQQTLDTQRSIQRALPGSAL